LLSLLVEKDEICSVQDFVMRPIERSMELLVMALVHDLTLT